MPCWENGLHIIGKACNGSQIVALTFVLCVRRRCDKPVATVRFHWAVDIVMAILGEDIDTVCIQLSLMLCQKYSMGNWWLYHSFASTDLCKCLKGLQQDNVMMLALMHGR